MATFTGSSGVILVGSDQVAEVRNYSIEENMDTIEDSAMGDTSRTFKSGLKSFSGSADVFFDDTDTSGQGALTVGSSVTISFQMEGNTTGDHKLSGTALVTSRSISASFDGMVEASISFTGTGALTEGTVA
jgi:predicted secreted protein